MQCTFILKKKLFYVDSFFAQHSSVYIENRWRISITCWLWLSSNVDCIEQQNRLQTVPHFFHFCRFVAPFLQSWINESVSVKCQNLKDLPDSITGMGLNRAFNWTWTFCKMQRLEFWTQEDLKAGNKFWKKIFHFDSFFAQPSSVNVTRGWSLIVLVFAMLMKMCTSS